MRLGYILLATLPILVVGCAETRNLDSSRGTVIKTSGSVADLNDAMEEADDHCGQYDRAAVLQSVSADGGDYLAAFDCQPGRGSGIAVILKPQQEVDAALPRAENYCENYDRIPVLQSVSRLRQAKVASFNCATS